MDCQIFGLFDELNAQTGFSNELRNVPCATRHLPGPLEPATAQRRPTFFHRHIFGLSDPRGHFKISAKSEVPMKMASIKTAACPEHVGVWGYLWDLLT
jgi:hypothetical protein